MSKRTIASFVVVVVALAGFLVSRAHSNVTPELLAKSDPLTQKTIVQVGQKYYNVELAVTTEQQQLGLGERDGMDKNAGMLFVFEPSQQVAFWMKDMRFPLTIVWIKNDKVLGIEPNLSVPAAETDDSELPLYRPSEDIDYALELNADQAQYIHTGDPVRVSSLKET